VAFEHPDMRRIQLAWVAMSFALWSFTIALGVFAFDAGGATAVGLAGFVRLLPSALASPFAGLVGDRYPRRQVLLASALAGAAALAAATAAAATALPPGVVFALAALFMLAISPYVPAEGALLPVVARTPQELAAANVAHSAMDNAGFLVGSLLTGVLLAIASPALVFGVAAGAAILAALTLAGVERDERPAYAAEIVLTAAVAQTITGARTLLRDPGLRLLAAALTILVFFEGAADVLVVIVALDLLGLGNQSVGYLNAAWGIGALAAAAALALLLDRGRLAAGLAAGSLLIGAATALPAAWVAPAAAYAAWLGIGAGYTLVEVAARTLMQRLGSDETLARVFGALETARLTAMALGSIAVPLAIGTMGIRGALLLLSAVMPAFALARWGALRSFEAGAPVAERPYALLRADPIFAPLPVAAVERLSQDAVSIEIETGDEVICEGDAGDRFSLIDRGEVEVSQSSIVKGTQRAGDSFGEIALLRDVTRTATVRATQATKLWAVEREAFIAAVTRHPRSLQAARGVAAGRVPEG
jgi:hypothetical protein